MLLQGGSPQSEPRQGASPATEIRLQTIQRRDAGSNGATSASDSEASDSEASAAQSRPQQQQVSSIRCNIIPSAS